jgi:hypothetical protein
MITCRRSAPIDQERSQREYQAMITPDRRLRRNLANRYLQDRAQMQADWFSGMGPHFPDHDAYATETQGPIQERTSEHLGYTDKPIIALRRMMQRALRDLEEGRDPPHVLRDPAGNRFDDLVPPAAMIDATEDWRTYWKRPQAVGQR